MNLIGLGRFRTSLPLGGFAFAIMIIFLRLPMEHENMKQKFKRIDYLGRINTRRPCVCNASEPND